MDSGGAPQGIRRRHLGNQGFNLGADGRAAHDGAAGAPGPVVAEPSPRPAQDGVRGDDDQRPVSSLSTAWTARPKRTGRRGGKSFRRRSLPLRSREIIDIRAPGPYSDRSSLHPVSLQNAQEAVMGTPRWASVALFLAILFVALAPLSVLAGGPPVEPPGLEQA